MTEESPFLVDLRGVVDLLSHHLYSSPRVYLRELIQNAVDAITAREQLDPGAPRSIRITPADASSDGCLHIVDTGIGLDADGIRDVLATIGASTKRDELGFARDSFLGQFGIGLLSCFLVTDEIRLRTRRCPEAGGDGETWWWTGRASGTYAVRLADEPLTHPGTEVIVAPRDHDDGLLSTVAVRAIASDVAAYLPIEITLVTSMGEETITGSPFPWDQPSLTGVARRAAATDLCEHLLGFSPLDVVELSDAASGVRGFAFVLPTATAHRGVHRLYSKRMLVSAAEPDVLPEWAFFVRAVINTDGLRLTASRESVHHDDLLVEARERLGDQLRRWLLRMAASDPTRAQEFFRVHHLGVKAMATMDDQMLELVGSVMTYESTEGALTLSELFEADPVLTYVDSVADYREMAPLARAQDVVLVNAGYAYDTALIDRWLATHPSNDARRLSQRELAAEFDELDADERPRFAALLDVARAALDRARCVPEVRSFRPEQVHAVLLSDRQARRELDRELVAEAASAPWAAALETLSIAEARPAFVLNAANPAVRRLADVGDPELQRLAVEALYAQTLVSGRHPLRPFDNALVARALPALIDRAIDGA